MGSIDEDARTKKRGHVLVVPLSSQSHISASLKIAKELCRRGLTVTFVSHGKDITKIKSKHSDEELRKLELHLVSLADQTWEPGGSPQELSRAIEEVFPPFLEKLVADRKAGLPGPTCILVDWFLVWTQDIVQRLEIPMYVFFASGMCYARLMQGGLELLWQGLLPVEEAKLKFDGVLNISGLPPMRFRDLPRNSREDPQLFRSIGEFLVNADALVVNTFYDLEAAPIDAFRKAWCRDLRTKIPEVFAIGPLSTISTFSDESFVEGLSELGSSCLDWLDNRPATSVLYICLGSMVRLNAQQIQALALALEASQQGFLWVLPQAGGNLTALDKVLPPGFEARVSRRGRIITGWVPQLQVLSHPAIKGFLSHCGWGSTLESITTGVPILAWPFQAEQHLNCRYLVEVLKVAIPVSDELNDDNVVERESLERGILRLMVEEEGRSMAMRVQELKLKAAAAVLMDGTSYKALQDLIMHMNSH